MLTRSFYIFTGLHSFLIGLFPFYIPVYLYSSGVSLSGICLFVAATGAGYCLTLSILDRLWKKIALSWIISWSFVSEILLLTTLLLLETDSLLLPLVGLANGIFSCSFWTIQRLLFVASVSPGNSGRNFGNTQIMVLLILKAAILLGGLFLEQGREDALFLGSCLVVVPAIILFMTRPISIQAAREVISAPPLSFKNIVTFRDNCHSRVVFAVDGVFLYLESYFWLISLFMVVQEDFRSLGLLTVVLALFFGALFLVIKNTIDSYPTNRLYSLTVLLYALSWLLRAVHGKFDNPSSMMASLAVIAFCTSLFRLSFNKRFFDNAKGTVACHYILIKSYISQFCLMIVFILTAISFSQSIPLQHQLTSLYMGAALIAPMFLLYKARSNLAFGQGTISASAATPLPPRDDLQ